MQDSQKTCVCCGERSVMFRRIPKPSPAMIVACLALAVALSGTGYATILALPANSVGTVQLKNNAVIPSKVKDHSLLAIWHYWRPSPRFAPVCMVTVLASGRPPISQRILFAEWSGERNLRPFF